MKVIPNHNGFCEGVQFYKDVEIDLSPSILKALGKNAYNVIEQPKEKEEKKTDVQSQKQVTGAKNK